jgi:hypothetical protein
MLLLIMETTTVGLLQWISHSHHQGTVDSSCLLYGAGYEV